MTLLPSLRGSEGAALRRRARAELTMMPLDGAGMRLRYLEWGAGEEVVVMLHDIALSADAWDEVGRELADDGYRRGPLTRSAAGQQQ